MTESREQLVGQLQRPGQRPENVTLITKNRPILTKAEQDAGIEWVDGRYDAGDIRRYGALGDDSAENYTALNNAIQSNDKVFVPDGTFLVTVASTSIQLTSDLKLQGPGTIRWTSNTATAPLFEGVSTDNVLISGVTFDGNYTTAGALSNSAHTLVFRDCENTEVTECYFRNTFGDAVYFGPLTGDQTTYCENANVHHCTFSDIGRNGIAAVTGRRHQYHHNLFLGSAGEWYGSAVIDLEPNNTSSRFEDFDIHHNQIFCDDINSGIRMLYVTSTTPTKTDNIRIHHNTVDITGNSDSRLILYYGAEAGGTPTDEFFEISHNICRAATLAANQLAISVIESSARLGIISYNEVQADAGISITGHSGTESVYQIHGNSVTVLGSAEYGIYVVNGDAGKISVKDNSVDIGTSTNEAIYVDASGDTVGAIELEGNFTDGDIRILGAPSFWRNNEAADFVMASADRSTSSFVTGTNIRNGNYHFEGSTTWDPASIADGSSATTTITVDGGTNTDAISGDYAEIAVPLDLQGLQLTSRVSSSNTVTIRLDNNTGGAIDLASATWRARVHKGH